MVVFFIFMSNFLNIIFYECISYRIVYLYRFCCDDF